jgi:CRISPR-associated exonuclease Cas4
VRSPLIPRPRTSDVVSASEIASWAWCPESWRLTSLGAELENRAALGLVLVVLAKRGRRNRGLGTGDTVALDDVTLFSERLGLVGRPDRIVREGEMHIPEEWKPTAKRVYPPHRLQLAAYFLLIEEEYGVRPPYGWVVIRDGERVKVQNTEGLRAEALAIAEEIREHRRAIEEEVPVRQPAAKCRACGQRGNCRQAR